MSRPALTDSDRFDVLDARDKLMRARGQHRQQGTLLKGKCPDICPERERYSRSAKNQVRKGATMLDAFVYYQRGAKNVFRRKALPSTAIRDNNIKLG